MQLNMNVWRNGMRFLLILFFSAFGCTYAPEFSMSNVGLEPIKPFDVLGFDTEVENLQPEFHWNASRFDESTYDFAIWKANPNRHAEGKQSWGVLVYYVEDLKTNYHIVDIILLPNTVYCWSVRERRIKDNYLGVWSNRPIADIDGHRTNTPYYFKTPPNADIPDVGQRGQC